MVMTLLLCKASLTDRPPQVAMSFTVVPVSKPISPPVPLPPEAKVAAKPPAPLPMVAKESTPEPIKPLPPVPRKKVPAQPKKVALRPKPAKVPTESTFRGTPVDAAPLAATGVATAPVTRGRTLAASPVESYRPPDVQAAYANNPKPNYPPSARRMGREGTVWLTVEVTETGRVAQVVIKTSSGFDSLDQAALAAVSRWQFIPAQRNGRPVVVRITLPMRFELQKE